jgi:hypothetical protein
MGKTQLQYECQAREKAQTYVAKKQEMNGWMKEWERGRKHAIEIKKGEKVLKSNNDNGDGNGKRW